MTDLTENTEIDQDEFQKINLTFAKLNLQWWINKQKSNSESDYAARIQFMKHRLERISGKNIKIR